MQNLFNHQELIRMMNQYHFLVKKEVYKPKEVIVENVKDDYVYLLVNGCAAAYLNTEAKSLYSAIGAGYMMGYYMVMDNIPNQFTFKALSHCLVYKYKKADLQYALSFSENYGFQFFIMKELTRPLYLKSMLLYEEHQNFLLRSFVNLVQILRPTMDEDFYIFSKEISTTFLNSYCMLSRSSFYQQLTALRDEGTIAKEDGCWKIARKIVDEHFIALNSYH
ncbi:cyclic nucleotide-binding domain-containing protein [Listeria costaricensis]|uniref:cyclic nucleotide-binding domain-containing protein n=1 Tax=Listeria costaricensis TaxID=2026604 RepID=UPI000C08241F|nr:Crp/Fnr family transcriptional regulator [Listeria costaricensis]